HRNTFILTLALALIIGSVCSLLIQWRALHDALIVGFPVAVVAIIAVLVWKYWPRGSQPEVVETPEDKPVEPGSALPPVLTSVVLAACLAMNSGCATTSGMSKAPAGKASIISADYAGTVNDRVAELEATLQFFGANKGEVVPLFGDDVAVQDFTVERGRAELVRNGSNLSVQFDSSDAVTLRVKMLVKVAGDVTKRHLSFKIPAALSSHAGFDLAESGADVDFPAAISCQRTLEKHQTRVEAVIGSADHIELLWTPRVKRAEEVAATVFCRNAALVTFGGGVMNVRATLDYQITQGELRQVRVQLPAGQKLLRVEGSDIRTWEVKPASAGIVPASDNPESTNSPAGMPALPGGQILVVDLIKGIPLGWRLTMETEKILDALPANIAVELPRALEVKREDGLVALSSSDELGLSVESVLGLERVDTEEFTRVGLKTKTKLASAFRFSDPKFTLRIH
ncbi:MAG TPA: hypothetical protein VFF11_00920, partial [Candidatus Binatia bacterium]|nr:hypothetical protein [Candidatus Binatia bacterium]